MSFLAPLFMLGAAAIAVPIILHLIRRQAKGEQEFSSLIFLDPSPPTLMQRNRIDQWLLLLLRSLAILLLAAAFARPYWNTLATSESPRQETRRAILVDTSASMTREGIWSAVVDEIQSSVRNAQPLDALGLYTFDDHVQSIVSIEDSLASPTTDRANQILAAAASLQPGWRGTNLGLALATVGDRLLRTEETDQDEHPLKSEIVLISDFQSGSAVDRLENYQWPTECKLTIKRIDPKRNENVSAGILHSKEESLIASSGMNQSTPTKTKEKLLTDGLAIRLTNHDSRSAASVALEWIDLADRPIAESRVEADVPLAGNVVVRIPKLEAEAGRLRLNGDATNFDNDRYVARPPKREFQLLCLDKEDRTATESLGFFLKQLPFDDETRDVKFQWRAPNSSEAWPDKRSTPVIVASHDMLDSDAVGLKNFLAQGGHVVWVLDQALDDSARIAQVEAHWLTLTGDHPPRIYEAKTGRDAMFEEIDFSHPLFHSLADSKFNDFTKIRFWRHRSIEIDEDEKWTIVARFDDSSPVIAYRRVGEGTLWLMTAGWQPSESQLALSSKFVPILSGIFALAAPAERSLEALVSGDTIEGFDDEVWSDNAGKILDLESRDDGRRTFTLNRPGFYQVTQAGQKRWVAVNLPIAESDTRPMELERLERSGVITSDAASTQAMLDKKDQLRGVELEGEQRIWRWLMLGMLAAVVLETFWGMRSSYAMSR